METTEKIFEEIGPGEWLAFRSMKKSNSSQEMQSSPLSSIVGANIRVALSNTTTSFSGAGLLFEPRSGLPSILKDRQTPFNSFFEISQLAYALGGFAYVTIT